MSKNVLDIIGSELMSGFIDLGKSLTQGGTKMSPGFKDNRQDIIIIDRSGVGTKGVGNSPTFG